jgi:hypothetical protein
MMKKGQNPQGKKMNTRPRPEKEEVMNTTKTLKAIALVFAWIVCLQCEANAADENIALAKADKGAGYTMDVRNAYQGERAPAYEANGAKAVAAIILADVVTPWGAVPGLITVYGGIGMVVNALTPDKTDTPKNAPMVERIAQNKPETKAAVELAANDRK